MKIYKYELEQTAYQEIAMPAGARILDAQMQGNTLVLWALVDPVVAIGVARSIEIYMTGELTPADRKYIATVQRNDGIVIHIMEG